MLARARGGTGVSAGPYTGGTEGRWNRGDHRERLGGRGAADPAEAAPGGSPPGPATSLDENLRVVRRERRLRSRRQQQLVHVLHLRTIRVERWSPEALTSASRRDFPVTPIRSARSKSGSIRTWSSSARGAGPRASRRSRSSRSTCSRSTGSDASTPVRARPSTPIRAVLSGASRRARLDRVVRYQCRTVRLGVRCPIS